jgi:2',3'-cyclic-nucleotide 2'-phosphodiesterase (5'-nucleotidase family)
MDDIKGIIYKGIERQFIIQTYLCVKNSVITYLFQMLLHRKKNNIYICYIIGILLLSNVVLYSEDACILFTANINGNLENCNCGPNSTRGIGRIKTFFSEFCKEYSNTIIVDGGDYFNPYSSKELNSTMLQALHFMEYNLLVPGDQEFIEGMDFFLNYQKQMKGKILASNLNLNTGSHFIFTINKIDIIFYGFLSGDAFDLIKMPEKMECHPFFKIKQNRKKGAIQIVVYHGEFNRAKDILQDNGWIDLILLGHEQYTGSLKLNHQLIIGGGKDSEGVTIIKITKKRENTEKNSNKSSKSNVSHKQDIKYQMNWSEEYDVKDYILLTGYVKINGSIVEDENIFKLIDSYHNLMENYKTRN